MNILFAADGSKFTKKALAYLATHESLCSGNTELVVVHVQPPIPPRVKSFIGAAAVADYHADEAQKVLQPIERFLSRHGIACRVKWVVGAPARAILDAAAREKAQLIVMGTHGHGLLGQAVLGSVAQRVVTESTVPVLLVK